jgi:hypothetical protein
MTRPVRRWNIDLRQKLSTRKIFLSHQGRLEVSAEVPDRTGHRVPAAAPNGVDQTTDHLTHPWMRYVALGDSFTERVGDPEEGIRGPLYRGALD